MKGLGNVITQIAAQTSCHTRGIELRTDLHNYAVDIRDFYYRKMKALGRKAGVIEVVQVFININFHHCFLISITAFFY
jgi:hypothetical protein